MAPLFSSSSPSRVTALERPSCWRALPRSRNTRVSAEHIGKDHVVDGLKTHQFHGAANQTAALALAAGSSATGHGCGTAATTAGGTNLVEREEGETTGSAALQQLDRPGGDAVVVDHHLPQPGAGRHFQGQAVLVFDFAELGHRAVDAIQSGFEQQAKCPRAAAFLEGITPAFQSGDLPFQPGLFLFQPGACALLDRERFRSLLHRLLAAGQGTAAGVLPLLLQGLQGLLDLGLLLAVTVEVCAEFLKTFGVLALALLPLLQLLLKGSMLLCKCWRRSLRRFCSSSQAPERPATSAIPRRAISTAASEARHSDLCCL